MDTHYYAAKCKSFLCRPLLENTDLKDYTFLQWTSLITTLLVIICLNLYLQQQQKNIVTALNDRDNFSQYKLNINLKSVCCQTVCP